MSSSLGDQCFYIQYPTGGRRETYSPDDHDLEYMGADHILEYGVQDDFVARSDLASFAHKFFAPTLELGPFKKAIQEYRELFIEQGSELGDNKYEPPKETFVSLLTIVRLDPHRQYSASDGP